MIVAELTVAADTGDILGECPVWDVNGQKLWWVDSRAPALRSLDPVTGSISSWPVPEVIGSFAIRKNGGFLVALTTCLAFFDPVSGRCENVATPEPLERGFRFNDGKCDRLGRFWVGSKPEQKVPEGSLFRFDADRRCAAFESGIAIPNSLAWSPDDKTMYFSDSLVHKIFAYDYDSASGTPTNRRVFAEAKGAPDGATVDREGYLWSADYLAWQIVRYAPDGRVDRIVPVPVQQPTSCAFGGRNLDKLYVTTAKQRLDAAALAAQPLAGCLLALDVGVRGLPEPYFAG